MRKVDNGENMDFIMRQMPETLTFEIFNVIEPAHSVPSREELQNICDDAVKRSKPRALPKANIKSPHDPNTAKEHEQGTEQEDNRIQPVSGDVEEIAHASVCSIHENARLCAILRDHPDCRAALINSGKEMTPAALDAKLRWDYFWATVVEKFLMTSRIALERQSYLDSLMVFKLKIVLPATVPGIV